MGKSRNNAIFAGFVTSSTPGAKDSLLFENSSQKFIYTDVQLTDNETVTESVDGKIVIKEVFTSSIQQIPAMSVLGNVSGTNQPPQAITIETTLTGTTASAHDTLATVKGVQSYVESSIPTITATAINTLTSTGELSGSGNLKIWTENEISGKNISNHTHQKRIWIDKGNRIIGGGHTAYYEFNNYHAWVWREQLNLPDADEVPVKVYAGFHFVCVLTQSGKLYFAGLNYHNMFSVNDPQSSNYRQSQLLRGMVNKDGSLDDVKFTKIAFSNNHHQSSIIALADDGSVYAAGYNQFGALGTGDTKSTYNDDTNNRQIVSPLWNPTPTKATDIFHVGTWDGARHPTTTVILLEDYTIRTCGYGAHGQMGNNTSTESNPNLINPSLSDVKSILVWGLGRDTGVFAVTGAGGGPGNLYGWGYGKSNPFGNSPVSNSDVLAATQCASGSMIGNVLQVYRGNNQLANEPTFCRCTNEDWDNNSDKRQFRWFGAGKNNQQMIQPATSTNAVLAWEELDDVLFNDPEIDVHTLWYGEGTQYQTHFVIATNYKNDPLGVEELYTIGTWFSGNMGIGRAPWDTFARESISISGYNVLRWTKVPLTSSIVSKIIKINSHSFSFNGHNRTTEIITSDGNVYFAGRDYYTFNSPNFGDHYTTNFTKVDRI